MLKCLIVSMFAILTMLVIGDVVHVGDVNYENTINETSKNYNGYMPLIVEDRLIEKGFEYVYNDANLNSYYVIIFENFEIFLLRLVFNEPIFGGFIFEWDDDAYSYVGMITSITFSMYLHPTANNERLNINVQDENRQTVSNHFINISTYTYIYSEIFFYGYTNYGGSE